MDVIEYTPTRDQYAYTFGGAAAAMRVLHPAHPIPPLPDPEECLLPDVLRLGSGACDRKQGFVETALLGAEELLERRNRSAEHRFLGHRQLGR